MPELAGRGKRDPDDYYATTPELAELCCRTLRGDFIASPGTILEPGNVLEPGCGAGSWLPGIRTTWPEAEILGIERNPDLAAYARKRGFTVEQRDMLQGIIGEYDLIVGNPPFKYADELIPMLLTRLRPGGVLAFLLRLNFFEGQDRYERFWRIYPAAAAYPLPARPGFTADGATDGTGYMLCCWKQGFGGSTVLRHLDNRHARVRWHGSKIRPDPAFPDPRPNPDLALPEPPLRVRRLLDWSG